MTDKEFREEYKPLQVPAHFDAAASTHDQVLYALAQLDNATADEVAAKLKELHNNEGGKELVGQVHSLLTEWHNKGLIASNTEENGDLRYNLHKITEANDGHVNPDLLAPGLD